MNPMNIFSYYSELITEIVERLVEKPEIAVRRKIHVYRVGEWAEDQPQAQAQKEKPIPDVYLKGPYCEPPRNPSHGEISTGYAFNLSPVAKMSPRKLAEMLAKGIEKLDGIAKVEVAGAGFINMTLEPRMWQERITDILEMGEKWGNNNIGKGQTINVEYVSANPTGPLHAAHARGGIIGDSLANLLEKSGYKITREYYVNDSGNQVDILAQSVYTRYLQLLGDKTGIVGKDEYSGEYVKEIAQKLFAEYGDSLICKDDADFFADVTKPLRQRMGEGVGEYFAKDSPKELAPAIKGVVRVGEELVELQINEKLRDNARHKELPEIRDFAIKDMMQGIKEDLTRLNIHIDRFSSERELVAGGAVDKAVAELKKKDLIYDGILDKPKSDKAEDWEPHEQMLFRSTAFGDDVDRTLQKSDGSWTYFATDIAYHLDKLNRGDTLINIWGADHGGYVKRMKSAVAALSGRKDSLNVQLVQLVKLMDKGEPVKMSKRAGTFVALSDVLDAVGADILRFIMLTRRGDQAMDFDYAEVTQQTRDNPVFYVQYAHARAHSVLNQKPGERDAKNLARLTDDGEMQLIRHLASFPRQVEAAAENLEPHRIAFYLIELAGLFHALWNRGREDANLRFLGVEAELEDARLQLVEATAIVLQNGLRILGVSAPKEM